ncbi:SPOR domain-containing protein [Candidatus Sulfidibacterium hydrothermale]|uniref:SPOR domain-containing protein n=1 Tax=Candidatus Sulfidibacterium hydrothermale TaxID=2875962 RepID=UPI001F0B2AA2|nr:SPOR domain-containing protein [Candidatus Sulfidibacterium hydrothermale]UBM62841.1 SPOR domain-containing protein [Candidatus Sulfidibacterium hydrothermale]
MIKIKIILLFTIMAGAGSLLAQDSIPFHRTVKADFIGDARIDTLLQMHVMQNEKFPVISGYRIQIYKESGNKALEKALEIRDAFEEKYHVPAYITFNEPYYRVRVGDFRSRLDAIRFLEKIKRAYPLAWEIKDDIRIHPANLSNQP